MINSTSFGDLAQSFLLQRRGTDLKTEMARLNQELVTGQVSDVKSILAGNVSYLAGVENDLRLLQAYDTATTEAAFFTNTMQNALERVQDASSNLAQDLIATARNAPEPVLNQLSDQAGSEMQSIIGALNSYVGGRAVFGGTATRQNPVAEADTILTALRTAIGGATAPDDMVAAVDAWFDSPTGYADIAYQGSDIALAPLRIGAEETVSANLTANDVSLRDVLKGAALAALAGDPGLGLSADAKRALLDRAGTSLLSAQDGLTAVRANVGASQERIDTVATRNAAERTSLSYAKGTLLSADPYETATKLEEVQFQLQSLYTVTARMSDLSLVNFIR